LHCIDPFDASGDLPSVSSYDAIARQSVLTLRQRFDAYVQRAGLTDWIVVHESTVEKVAANWTSPIDMLFLDGDQSPAGARSAYDAFAPFLKAGGVLAVHNSGDAAYAPGHDGSRRLVVETVRAPEYCDIRCVDSTTFARKAG
jgi:hypothetical protein